MTVQSHSATSCVLVLEMTQITVSTCSGDNLYEFKLAASKHETSTSTTPDFRLRHLSLARRRLGYSGMLFQHTGWLNHAQAPWRLQVCRRSGKEYARGPLARWTDV